LRLIDRIKRQYLLFKHTLNGVEGVPVADLKLQRLKRKIEDIGAPLFPETTSWETNRKELRDNILKMDVSNFLNWNVVKRTMVFDAPTVEYIKVSENNLLLESIQESSIGNPVPYFLNIETSGNLVHHAYSLSMLLDKASFNSFERVIELGGGYGSMCRLFRNMGYSKVYTIFDLPEFSALQEYYLNSVNDGFTENTMFTGDVAALKGGTKPTLMVATWSLSEMPLVLREEILEGLVFEYCLIAFQSEFEGINNLEYFAEFEVNYPSLEFRVMQIEHLAGHYYLTGVKKKPVAQ